MYPFNVTPNRLLSLLDAPPPIVSVSELEAVHPSWPNNTAIAWLQKRRPGAHRHITEIQKLFGESHIPYAIAPLRTRAHERKDVEYPIFLVIGKRNAEKSIISSLYQNSIVALDCHSNMAYFSCYFEPGCWRYRGHDTAITVRTIIRKLPRYAHEVSTAETQHDIMVDILASGDPSQELLWRWHLLLELIGYDYAAGRHDTSLMQLARTRAIDTAHTYSSNEDVWDWCEVNTVTGKTLNKQSLDVLCDILGITPHVVRQHITLCRQSGQVLPVPPLTHLAIVGTSTPNGGQWEISTRRTTENRYSEDFTETITRKATLSLTKNLMPCCTALRRVMESDQFESIWNSAVEFTEKLSSNRAIIG